MPMAGGVRAPREKFARSVLEMVAEAAQLMKDEDASIKGGESTDLALLRRYRLYKRHSLHWAHSLVPGCARDWQHGVRSRRNAC